MVGVDSEVGEKKRLAARLMASAIGFDSDEYRIDLCEGFRIFRLQNPALFGGIVFIENAQIDGLLAVWASPPHAWKYLPVLSSDLLVQIVGVKDQDFPLV